MSAFKDRTGMRYGRLIVIKYAGKDNRGKHLWLCKCDCGNEKIVVGDNLSSGRSNSCGCLKKEFLSRRGNQYGLYENREEAILKVQYSHLKRRNRKFGGSIMPFEEFVKKSKSPCFYCKSKFSREIQDRRNETKGDGLVSDTVVRCNGIDRIDSKIGYTSKNTVSCCKYCNTAKNTMSQDDFAKWIEMAYINFAKKRIEEAERAKAEEMSPNESLF